MRLKAKVAALIAALLVAPSLGTHAQAAPVGNPFLRGLKNPSELAAKVEASLKADPTGQGIIDPARCRRDGSCATPQDYLLMIEQADPGAHLTFVEQLPDFFRSLKMVQAPRGEYWMACLKVSPGRKFSPVLHCLSRNFKKGEQAWVDAATHVIVLAEDCTNPVEKPVPPVCAYVEFYTARPDTVVRFALLGPRPVLDDCIGVKRAGEQQFETWWRDECASAYCSFEEDAAVVGEPVQLIGSYVPKPGWHVLRVPLFLATEASADYRVVLCLDRSGEHSDGVGVQWFDYRARYNNPTAIVWYSPELVPHKEPPLAWTFGDWAHGVRALQPR